jgi:hypothetical protein
MWRTRKDFLRSCALLFVLFGCWAVCIMIVATSWPENERSRIVQHSPIDAPVAVVHFSDVQRVDIVPVVYQTGSIVQPVDLRR